MNSFKRCCKVGDQFCKILIGCWTACDEDIVSVGACDERRDFYQRCTKPSADLVADDSVADLFGDGEAETGVAQRLRVGRPGSRF